MYSQLLGNTLSGDVVVEEPLCVVVVDVVVVPSDVGVVVPSDVGVVVPSGVGVVVPSVVTAVFVVVADVVV